MQFVHNIVPGEGGRGSAVSGRGGHVDGRWAAAGAARAAASSCRSGGGHASAGGGGRCSRRRSAAARGTGGGGGESRAWSGARPAGDTYQLRNAGVIAIYRGDNLDQKMKCNRVTWAKIRRKESLPRLPPARRTSASSASRDGGHRAGGLRGGMGG